MIKNLYAVRDVKCGYWPPSPQVNEAMARREFAALCADPKMAYMCNDLQLFKVGSFDDETGDLTCSIEFVCNAVDVMEKPNEVKAGDSIG